MSAALDNTWPPVPDALWEGLQADAQRAGHQLNRGRGHPPIYWIVDPQDNTTWLPDIVDVQRAVSLMPSLAVLGLTLEAALALPSRDMNLGLRSAKATDETIAKARTT